MKAAILLFIVAIVGFVALVPLTMQGPSGSVVQPSRGVLGYCPVQNSGKYCEIGGRGGFCQCQTLDVYKPLYSQRDNCHCVIPSYSRGTAWAP